jgi:hypothetical protein
MADTMQYMLWGSCHHFGLSLNYRTLSLTLWLTRWQDGGRLVGPPYGSTSSPHSPSACMASRCVGPRRLVRSDALVA